MQATATSITAPAPYTNPHTVLSGHTNQATAYRIDDHPYNKNSEVLCRKEFWVETATKGMKSGKQRIMTRTSNPSAGHTWNAPKAGAFFDLAFLFINAESGDIEGAGINVGSIAEIAAFKSEWYDILPANLQAKLEDIEAQTVAIDNVIANSGAPAPIAAPAVTPVIAPAAEIEIVAELEPETPAEPEVQLTPVTPDPVPAPVTVEAPDPVQPQPVFNQVLTDVRQQCAGLEVSLINVPGRGYILRSDNTDLCDPTNLNAIQKLLNKQERALANGKDYFAEVLAKKQNQAQAQPRQGTRRSKNTPIRIEPKAALLSVKAGTKIAKMIDMMAVGATIDELLAEINPNKSSLRVYFTWDLPQKGYGVEERDGVFHLLYPDGVNAPAPHITKAQKVAQAS